MDYDIRVLHAIADMTLNVIRRRRSRMIEQGMTPETLLVGIDVYAALGFEWSDLFTTRYPGEGHPVTVDGMRLVCNPLMAPDELLLLPSPGTAALRADVVRAVNEGGTG